MNITFGKEAREQMLAIGATEKDIEDAIRGGDQEKDGDDRIISHYKYFYVVFEHDGEKYFVIGVRTSQ